MTTIIIDRAVVEQALEALTVLLDHLDGVPADKIKLADWIPAEANLRAALAQQAEPESCAWHQDGDSESDLYATSCRHYFSLNEGTPEDNKMHWCCYCGKRIVQELITEEDDDE